MVQRMWLWVIGMCAGVVVLTAGCPAVLVGGAAVGTVAYLEGDLKSVEPHPLDDVYAACRRVLKERDMKTVGKEEKGKDRAVINARDEADRKITIVLTTQYEGITNISIRFGVWGDETRSRDLYQKVHDYLKK